MMNGNARSLLRLVQGAFLFGVTCLSLPAHSDTPAQIIESITQPPGATIQSVSLDSIHNTLVTAIATIHSPASVESVLQFYREQWKRARDEKIPGFVETQIPGWRLISRLQDNNTIVVQLNDRPQGGANGYISVTRFDQQTSAQSHGVFSDLTPLSTNQSVDGVDSSLMRVYGSNASISGTHAIYRRRLLNKGWQLLLDTQVQDSVVMILARGASRLELAFVESAEFVSAVVVHRLTSG